MSMTIGKGLTLVRKVEVLLGPDEVQCFTRYQHQNKLGSVEEAVKHAALHSLPPRRKWKKK